ncbi:MAG: cellulase family glycosylhydrolase [Sporocytophaga sp.]|uniref:cellulase family glycosylhydrolase n=1 Tax=Sporocytophaga sp. TaxID=2231183 RepID=UPI001B144722|nr:cellulase family glycosylhydrolase [Sporocytophaga sp.]MBO9698653.1 cellulase family glycosylhydrolase [Sporocytophaga sp.]
MKKRLLSLALLANIYFAQGQNFIKRNGTELVLSESGEKIMLRGLAFGNRVWINDPVPSEHHTEADIERVSKIGMNCIRFYMNYQTFESDAAPYTYKDAGWNWIDQNIAWAKKHNVYLILNIHVPQGGFQSQCKGDALWTNQTNQDRLVALWKAIAEKYKNEPQIAGYDLLNEPTPSGTIQNWDNLATRITDAIREVDNNHLIILANAIALGCNYSFNDGKNNFPRTEDENVMYTLHSYDPYEYTHQNQAWAGTGEGGKYPDPNVLTPPNDLEFATGQYNNKKLPTGNSDWTYFKGLPFKITNEDYILGRPVLYGQMLGTGSAFYDDVTINEVDANGNVIREVLKSDFDANTKFYFWKPDAKSGEASTATVGHTDNFSIKVTGTDDYSTTILNTLQFKPEMNKYYAISGWMKGEAIPTGSNAAISMEFYTSKSGAPVLTRDYEYVKTNILHLSNILREWGYPVYYGEFGAVRECFGEKGGQIWVKDVLHVLDSLGFHFTYHDYREDAFGLYKGDNGIVDESTVNQPLYDAFITYFEEKATSITPLTESSIAQVYPNPSKDDFNLSFKTPVSGSLQVYDETGRNILSKNINSATLISFGELLPKGFYFGRLVINDKPLAFKISKQ